MEAAFFLLLFAAAAAAIAHEWRLSPREWLLPACTAKNDYIKEGAVMLR